MPKPANARNGLYLEITKVADDHSLELKAVFFSFSFHNSLL